MSAGHDADDGGAAAVGGGGMVAAGGEVDREGEDRRDRNTRLSRALNPRSVFSGEVNPLPQAWLKRGGRLDW